MNHLKSIPPFSCDKLDSIYWGRAGIDIVPFGVTFVFCLFVGLEQGILIGTAVNLGMLLYTTARPRLRIHKHQVIKAFF